MQLNSHILMLGFSKVRKGTWLLLRSGVNVRSSSAGRAIYLSVHSATDLLISQLHVLIFFTNDGRSPSGMCTAVSGSARLCIHPQDYRAIGSKSS